MTISYTQRYILFQYVLSLFHLFERRRNSESLKQIILNTTEDHKNECSSGGKYIKVKLFDGIAERFTFWTKNTERPIRTENKEYK